MAEVADGRGQAWLAYASGEGKCRVREPADRLSADQNRADHERDWLDRGDRSGATSGVREELARRLTRLAPFHPSSTAEAARAARRAGDQGDRREGGGRGEQGESAGGDARDGGARREDRADGLAEWRRDDAGRQDGQARGHGPDERHGDVGLDQAGHGVGRGEAARLDGGADGRGDEGQDGAPRDDREAALESAGDAGADRPEVDYWGRVEEFERLWEQHVERWPGAPGGGDQDWSRPGDPPSSWRGEGGRYLRPEQNAEADQLIAALRAPEPDVTAVLQAIERDNAHGARLAGLEHRIKDAQRLKEKIVDKMTVKGDISPLGLVNEIKDTIRYTFCSNRSSYVAAYYDVRQRLEAAGYRMNYSESHWLSDPEYKGINSQWNTRDGKKFELQFHTQESFHAKEHLTHRSYDRIRSPETSRAERRKLITFQHIVSAAVPPPPGIARIPDHEGRI